MVVRKKVISELDRFSGVGVCMVGISAGETFYQSICERSGTVCLGLRATTDFHGKAGWENSSDERSGDNYKAADGSRYLRLTDFTTSNGPDVHVVLLRAEDKQLEHELMKGELDHVDLGTLKGNQGDQNYDLPAATDLNQYQTVAIYCERFHVLFGLAKLEEF
jgi:hypothetical protein